MKSKNQALDTSLNELALLLRHVVASIHSQSPTTQDYYGEYMGTLTTVADKFKAPVEDQKKLYLGIAIAMQRAGASKQGIQSALRVMGVI